MSVRQATFGSQSSLYERPTVRRLSRLDPLLLAATLLLIGYGLVMTYSTTAEDRSFTGDPMEFVIRGALFASLGLVVMFAVAFANYTWFSALSPLLYLATILSLVVVMLFGDSVLGGQRWIPIGGQRLQPSEFAKVLMIVVLARYWADRQDRARSLVTLAGAMLLLAVPFFLVFRQPDLGTSLVFIAICFGIAYLAGARLWQLTAMIAGAVAALPLLWPLLKPYQQARLTGFLDPYADPQGAGWNIIQSLIAVGSGQFTGKGLTAGTQSPLGYLPIAESDFVFAGLAEDLGFVGVLILFALYLVLLLAALRIAFRARDPFGALTAGGVVVMLAFQILVNVGMAVSLMPVTGIPLPFISHGGSSLLSICLALGLLQSIAMRSDRSRLRADR